MAFDKIQSFLNLPLLIKKEHFVFDNRPGVACLKNPLNESLIKCMSKDKGRKHPCINSDIRKDLRIFFNPYDKKLFELIKEKPWWPIDNENDIVDKNDDNGNLDYNKGCKNVGNNEHGNLDNNAFGN